MRQKKYLKFTKPSMPNDGTYSLFIAKVPGGLSSFGVFFIT